MKILTAAEARRELKRLTFILTWGKTDGKEREAILSYIAALNAYLDRIKSEEVKK